MEKQTPKKPDLRRAARMIAAEWPGDDDWSGEVGMETRLVSGCSSRQGASAVQTVLGVLVVYGFFLLVGMLMCIGVLETLRGLHWLR